MYKISMHAQTIGDHGWAMLIELQGRIKIDASAGNRTRIDCLEGNHANLYTTDACLKLTGFNRNEHNCHRRKSDKKRKT